MRLAKPTSALYVVVLVAVGVVVGRLVPPIVVRLDGTPPRLGWIAPLMLVAGALVVGIFAWDTWQTLHRKHERMTAQHGITMLSLAKSSAVVGALVAGFYGGYALAFVGSLDSTLGHERFVRGLAASVASLLLLTAALLLERACRIPDDDEDDDGEIATSPTDAAQRSSGSKGSRAKGAKGAKPKGGKNRPDPTPA